MADWQRTLRRLFGLAGVEGGHALRFRDTFAVEFSQDGLRIPVRVWSNTATGVLSYCMTSSREVTRRSRIARCMSGRMVLSKTADQHHVGQRRAAGDREPLAIGRPVEVQDVLLGELCEAA